VVNSLTKYTGNEGDVIAGLVAVNPGLPDAENLLRPRGAAAIEPPYARDLARLAAQIKHRAVLSRIEESTPRVAAFLASHPAVTLDLLGARAELARKLLRRSPGAPTRPAA
jgi:cystathionine beta-lyase/cystathionine gamma-synthase